MKLKSVALVLLTALMVVPAFAADDAEKKGKGKGQGGGNVAAALIKKLEVVGLTDEQTEKIKEMGKKLAPEMKELTAAAKLTPELSKKLAAAQKEIREAGQIKGKEVMKAAHEKAGLTAEQSEAMGKLNEARMKFQASVLAMLTDEQKAKLPKTMQRGAAAAKGKGKKKKEAAAAE
ncbi:hypothetical protein [Stieleria varia]|uniref:LTXXQ motif protein n=1 Tax=Stieleria varia TaxID=2528005 RepID=A0A5C6B5R3_9BACT|nr:hypothetical protein [Stieleria varia]TWU07625.1 hypothetical protein Pla52n_01980 [Stieleria varia]